MGDYSNICELRGRAKDGTGCTAGTHNWKYCGKTSGRKVFGTQHHNCTTADVDTLVEPGGTPAPTPAPSFTVQPSITGTPQVGNALTGNDGTILNGNVTARQWLLNGSAISGATGNSYTPVVGDIGGTLTYRVTATGTTAPPAVATSAGVGPVIAAGGGTTNNVIVANRGQMATTFGTPIGGLPTTSRREHTSSPQGAISNFVCIDHAYYINDSFNLASESTFTIKRYIEYPAGVFTQVTWGGATSKLIPQGLAVVVSDPVALTIPANTKFWERTVLTGITIGGATGNVPFIQLPAGPDVLGLDDGNAAGDFGNTGTIAASSGTSFMGCQAFVGTIAAANARGFLIFGDSIAFGQADATGKGSAGGSGYVARGLDPIYPYTKIVKSGSAAFNFAGATTGAKTFFTNLSAACGVTDMICEQGGGDLRQTGQTPTTVAASYQTCYTLFASGKRIYQTTILPRTDSTDGWITTVNQTPKTDGGWAQLSTLNDNIRGIQTQVTGIVEAADIAMTSRNSGIWKAPPAPSPDGVHPISTEAALIGAAVAPAVG